MLAVNELSLGLETRSSQFLDLPQLIYLLANVKRPLLFSALWHVPSADFGKRRVVDTSPGIVFPGVAKLVKP